MTFLATWDLLYSASVCGLAGFVRNPLVLVAWVGTTIGAVVCNADASGTAETDGVTGTTFSISC